MRTVVSIDGINVVSGETAAPNRQGYVLSPRASFKITGWRKSERDVAAFCVKAVDVSYTGKTYRPDNVEGIGVAAFPEYLEPAPAPMGCRGEAANKAAAPMAEEHWVSATVSGSIRQRSKLISRGQAAAWTRTSPFATTRMPTSLHAELFLRLIATSRQTPSRETMCLPRPD